MSEQFIPPERIGFVGLGQMGYPMARKLSRAGFRLAEATGRAVNYWLGLNETA